jgi:hypothetical protein
VYFHAHIFELAQLPAFTIQLANPSHAARFEVIHYISMSALDIHRLVLRGLKARLQYLLTGACTDEFAGVVWPSLEEILRRS